MLNRAQVKPRKMIGKCLPIFPEMMAYFFCLSSHGTPITYKQTCPRDIFINYRVLQQHSISENFIAFSSEISFPFSSWDETQISANYINAFSWHKTIFYLTIFLQKKFIVVWSLEFIIFQTSVSEGDTWDRFFSTTSSVFLFLQPLQYFFKTLKNWHIYLT